MGNKQTHGLQPQVVTSLRKETGFTHGEISDLYRQFRMDTKDLYMTVKQFNELYRGVFPHGNPEQFAERVFSTFDKRGKGKVDFHEFLSILSIQLKGNVKTKYEWVYEVIDLKKTGSVERDDVLHVITILHDFYAGLIPEHVTSPETYCDDVMVSLENPITKRSFVNAAMLSSSVYQMAEAVVKAALMPYEARQHQTGSYGKPRSDSVRARAMTAAHNKKDRKTSTSSNPEVKKRRTQTF